MYFMKNIVCKLSTFYSDLYAQNISTTGKSKSILWMSNLCFNCWKEADSANLGDTCSQLYVTWQGQMTSSFIIFYHACPSTNHWFRRFVVNWFSLSCAIHSSISISHFNFSTNGIVLLLLLLLFSMTSQCYNNGICDITMGHRQWCP